MATQTPIIDVIAIRSIGDVSVANQIAEFLSDDDGIIALCCRD